MTNLNSAESIESSIQNSLINDFPYSDIIAYGSDKDIKNLLGENIEVSENYKKGEREYVDALLNKCLEVGYSSFFVTLNKRKYYIIFN